MNTCEEVPLACGFLVFTGPPERLVPCTRCTRSSLGVPRLMTLDELKSWAARAHHTLPFLGSVVREGLDHFGISAQNMPSGMTRVFNYISDQTSVPRLQVLFVMVGSPRQFYREWNAAIPEKPRPFLNRLRLLHAKALVDVGQASPKEARFTAGFVSPDQARFWSRRLAVR